MTPDHHYHVKTELDRMNLFAEIGITDYTKGEDILALLASTGKIDEDLWTNYRVIVSPDLLESLKDAYLKRNNEIIKIKEIRVNYTGNATLTGITAPLKEEETLENVENDDRNPQRIGKDRKVKDTKLNNEDTPDKPAKRVTFQKPSLVEIVEYCKERGNNVDPEKWLDYYSSNGWKVGKNKMSDWKAAVRTWERNNFDSKQSFQKPVRDLSNGYTINPAVYDDEGVI
jgi:hypothetical protein